MVMVSVQPHTSNYSQGNEWVDIAANLTCHRVMHKDGFAIYLNACEKQ